MPTKRQNAPPAPPTTDPPAAASARERPSFSRATSTTPLAQRARQGAAPAKARGGANAVASKNPETAARRSRALAPRPTGMVLHTAEGLRKYVTAGERDAFLREAEQAGRAV